VVITTYILFLAIHGPLHLGHAESGWLLPLDFVLHGWPLVTANIAFYLYVCWLALCFIRGSKGRERLFISGWVAHLVLYPVEKLWPQSSQAIQYIGTLALVLSLMAALSLLRRPAPSSDPSERTA
jgi:hypothetical protein